MILKILPILILLMVLPDYYLYHHFLKRRGFSRRTCILWWVPSGLLVLMLLPFCFINTFEPSIIGWFNLYIFCFGILVLPKMIFSFFSLIGFWFCRFFHLHINFGNIIGVFTGLFFICVLVYGSLFGLDRLVVRHIDYSSPDLPASFNGYRIVQFSDAHVGTYTPFHIKAFNISIDSINAQKADAIIFCGDLINFEPAEIYPYIGKLSSLKAPDGVFSIMGNHDYPMYMKNLTTAQRVANLKELQSRERQFGWNLLLNEHYSIHRGSDSIVIAGEENDGRPPFPALANVDETLKNINIRSFIIMLQHDPSAWRKQILKKTNAQLTLSGHTHAMQFEIFGWSPASFLYKEWGGMYYQGNHAIYVTKGLGGVIPFRFGAWPEIVVITLHRKNNKS
jgi:uncharacterized protein